MHVAAAEFLGRDLLARRSANERWARKENRSLLAHYDVFVAHGRHIRTARCATAHHNRDLRDTLSGHLCLVVKNPSEVTLIWKNLGLHRQKRAARVDQV